jgi:hypothetical protein
VCLSVFEHIGQVSTVTTLQAGQTGVRSQAGATTASLKLALEFTYSFVQKAAED